MAVDRALESVSEVGVGLYVVELFVNRCLCGNSRICCSGAASISATKRCVYGETVSVRCLQRR